MRDTVERKESRFVGRRAALVRVQLDTVSVSRFFDSAIVWCTQSAQPRVENKLRSAIAETTKFLRRGMAWRGSAWRSMDEFNGKKGRRGGSRKGYSSRYKCAENVLARGRKLPMLPWAEFVAGYQRCAVSRVSCTRIAWLGTKETDAPPPPASTSKLFEWYIAPWIEIKIHRLLRRFAIYAVSRFAVDFRLLPFSRIFCHFRVWRGKHDDAQTHAEDKREDPRKFGMHYLGKLYFLRRTHSRVAPPPPLFPFARLDMQICRVCAREYARGAGIPRGSQCIFMGLEVQIY